MDKLMALLETVTLKDIIYFIVGVIGVLSIVVEKAKKIPFHPWTHLFEWIGSSLTKSVDTKLEMIEQQQKANNDAIIELDKKVERKFSEQQKEADEKEAKRLRASIISFSDSCRVHEKHTKNHFENIMRDYDDYMAYCVKHNLENHFIEGEKQYIESVYQECLRENKFL